MYSSRVFFSNLKPELGPSQNLELEPLVQESKIDDYMGIVFQSLVNDGKQDVILNASKPQCYYDEKQLREAAALEVANSTGCNDDCSKLMNRSRKGYDDTEKVQDSRDRNREHAKNTRLRKKAYVIKLKQLTENLKQQKLTEDSEKLKAILILQQRDATRRNVVRLFLSYRECNVQEKSVWDAIVEDSFVFTLPITPYRSFLKRDVISGSRVLVGINALLADTASLALMVENIGQGSCQWKESMKRGVSCRISYRINQNDFHCAGNLIMCRYSMRTESFQEVGAFSSSEQYGMLLCRFGNSNKLSSIEMVFDVMGFMQQLQRSTFVTPETSVVPNTVDMAMQVSKEARAIVKSDPPFHVLHINAAWTELSGVPQEAADGMPLSEVLRILPSQFEHFYDLIASCIEGQAGSAVLVTQCPITPDQPALVYLKMYPLTSSSETTITHFLGIYTDLPLSILEKEALVAHCKNVAMYAATNNNIPIPLELSCLDVSSSSYQQATPPISLPFSFNPESNRFIDNTVVPAIVEKIDGGKRKSNVLTSSGRTNNVDILGLPSNFKGVGCGTNSSDYIASSSCHYFNTNDMSEKVSTQFTESKIDSGQDSNSFDTVSGGTPESACAHTKREKTMDDSTAVIPVPIPPVTHANKRFKSDRTGSNALQKSGATIEFENIYFSYNL